MKRKTWSVLFFVLAACCLTVAQHAMVQTAELDKDIRQFLGREIAAHIADVKSLDPPQDRVVGALAGGQFSWGTFMRAVASYSALSGETTIAGKDVPKLIGQLGLIEARRGGKSFAQLYGAISMLHFGKDLKQNAVWNALTPDEQQLWRSLLDPTRFYDPKTRQVIDLPENYFGVAARVASIDYQLGIVSDRAFVDDVIDRAAEQFVKGNNLYSDDDLPAGRYDRYSNEYARYVYDAAEGAGRKDVMLALEPTLKVQMRTWWDLISPDGYGYPWGRSLGAISYIDTIEIVAFLAKHPQFRPVALPQLASAYYAAWNWLERDHQRDKHLLNVFGFGRGNYSYITKDREWQQTTAFLGKVSGAHAVFSRVMRDENVAAFPAKLELQNVARFEFFRKVDQPCGLWLVRHGDLRFALPIVTGTRPGVSDYLSAPYNLTAFAPPVEQYVPTATPYLELSDGRVIVASSCADEIVPAADGTSVRAVWRRWAALGTKAGEVVDTGITAEVNWSIKGNTLVRDEKLTANKALNIKHWWVVVPSTAVSASSRYEGKQRVDRFVSKDGSLDVAITATFPVSIAVSASGDTAIGKGSRGPVPLILNAEARNVQIEAGKPTTWQLTLTPLPSEKDAVGIAAVGQIQQKAARD